MITVLEIILCLGEIIFYIQSNINAIDALNVLIQIGLLCVAYLGLKTWREQLKGTTEYKLAKNLLLCVYKLRNELKAARYPYPFLSSSEATEDSKENSWEVAAYANRWKKVYAVLSEYEALSLEAEVMWGKETKEAHKDLNASVNSLYMAINMFALKKNGTIAPEEFQRDYYKTLYWHGNDDDYSKTLDEAVKKYEQQLKKYLK